LQTRNILFVINPISGGITVNKENLFADIKSCIPSHFTYEIKIWEGSKNTAEINGLISSCKFDTVVACGGDGTINFVAQQAMASNLTLGIVPMGSGNGLARHLGIPLDRIGALKNLSTGQEIKIDTGTANGHNFTCTAGVGFDALIGDRFSSSRERGFLTYLKITFIELITYRPKQYTLTFNGKTMKVKAFLISFANASQYGNDVFIAPQADIQDGLIDICIIKPFNIFHIPLLSYRIMKRSITKSSRYMAYKSSKIELLREEDGSAHVDGEPIKAGTSLSIHVNPASLKVIVPGR
jgi:diacylglycerol kinase (ATP)